MRPRGLYIEKSVRTVMSVRSVMVGYPPSAWPRKSGHSQFGDMRPWDWPPDCPTHQIRLHERCEGPWWDCGGQPEGGR
jgi:hypothetical protein